MNIKVELTRRAALLGAGGAIAGAGLASSNVAFAAAEKQGAMTAPIARYAVGDFEVNTLLDGAVTVGDPQKTFGMNVEPNAFVAHSDDNFIPSDTFKAYFTVPDRGSEKPTPFRRPGSAAVAARLGAWRVTNEAATRFGTVSTISYGRRNTGTRCSAEMSACVVGN